MQQDSETRRGRDWLTLQLPTYDTIPSDKTANATTFLYLTHTSTVGMILHQILYHRE
jgi:hypothetical protein